MSQHTSTSDSDAPDLTNAITSWLNGDDSELGELLYRELTKLAKNRLRNFPGEQSLDPPGLIAELYLSLRAGNKISGWYANRRQFYGLALMIMHRILIDRNRARRAAGRGGDLIRVPFREANGAVEMRPYENVKRALDRVYTSYPEEAQMVDLQFFGGLSVAEIAEVSGLSTYKVKRALAFGRACLRDELTSEG